MKKAGESRKERRAEEPRDRPTGRTLAQRREMRPDTDKERAKSTLPRPVSTGRVKAVDLLEGTEPMGSEPAPGAIQCRGAE